MAIVLLIYPDLSPFYVVILPSDNISRYGETRKLRNVSGRLQQRGPFALEDVFFTPIMYSEGGQGTVECRRDQATSHSDRNEGHQWSLKCDRRGGWVESCLTLWTNRFQQIEREGGVEYLYYLQLDRPLSLQEFGKIIEFPQRFQMTKYMSFPNFIYLVLSARCVGSCLGFQAAMLRKGELNKNLT